MNTTLKPIAMALIAAYLTAMGTHAVAEPQERFIERKAEGWFFYNEELEKEPEEPPEPEPIPPPQNVTTTTPPAQSTSPSPPASAEPKPPAPLSAKWLRENMQKYMDAAFDNPTVENVQAFLYLQRYAMDQSSEFAQVAERARLGNPMLDETTRRPLATYASQDLDRQAGKARTEILASLAEKVGVFFFYESDCGLCRTMSPILAQLNRQFVTTPISMDGKDLPGDPFPNMRPDAGHAEQLGVQVLPSVYLASPDGEFVPVAQGAVSLTDLQERIVLGALQQGWITPEDFNRTRPITNADMSLAKAAPLSALEEMGITDETGFIPPEVLLQHMANAQRGMQQ